MKIRRRKPLYDRRLREDPDTPVRYRFNMKHPFNRFNVSLREGLTALGWNEDEVSVAQFIVLHWDKNGSASLDDWDDWVKCPTFCALPAALKRLQENGFIFEHGGRIGFAHSCPALGEVLTAATAAARPV